MKIETFDIFNSLFCWRGLSILDDKKLETERKYWEGLNGMDINFSCLDFEKFLDKCKKGNNCLIYFDPPYINSCNIFYGKLDFDFLRFFSVIKSYLNNKETNVIFVHIINDFLNNWMQCELNNVNFITYKKTYQICKKNVEHCLIKNYC